MEINRYTAISRNGSIDADSNNSSLLRMENATFFVLLFFFIPYLYFDIPLPVSLLIIYPIMQKVKTRLPGY